MRFRILSVLTMLASIMLLMACPSPIVPQGPDITPSASPSPPPLPIGTGLLKINIASVAPWLRGNGNTSNNLASRAY